MKLSYPPVYVPPQPSALRRALHVWLLSNLGGTYCLFLDFNLDQLATESVAPLLTGLLAALISLTGVPLIFLFLTLAHRTCTGWRCRLIAGVGVFLVFALENTLVLHWLPEGSFSYLLSISRPYLGAAILAVLWLYGPVARAKPAPAARLLSVWWR